MAGQSKAKRGGRKGAPERPKGRAEGKPRRKRRGVFRFLAFASLFLGFLAGLWGARWILEQDRLVIARFEGRRFDVPSKVFSAPQVVYPGTDWQRVDLAGWLIRSGYREQPEGGRLRPGRYVWAPGRLRIHLRSFDHPLRPEPARELEFRLSGGEISDILDSRTGNPVDVVVLEPEPVSAFLGQDREQRDLVTLEELPPHLVSAVYAVEDKRFEEHHGIDLRRVVGALLANLRAGQIEQGASTLTQQLVKNFFLTPERTFERKLREAVMALIIEARYSKPEILEAYLNEIYLGQRGPIQVHGVGEAARLYFGKSARSLTASESALLAAIIQSPNGISPFKRPEKAVARRNMVLELMFEQERINWEVYQAAREDPLRVSSVSADSGDVRYFLDALSRQLPSVYDEAVLSTDGLRIYSTLEPRVQRAAVKALRAGLDRIEARSSTRGREITGLQGCLIAMRPQTGEILALVGGRNYGGSQWNRCIQARRPVGSIFKPFVYVAALDPAHGPLLTLADTLEDTPLEIPTPESEEPWAPQNYDHEFRGTVGVREALERSLNVPAARLAQQVGIRRVAQTAQRLGLTSPLPEVPSLALGTAEVAPLEVAVAYSTLANGGRKPTPRTFVDLVEADGVVREVRPLEGSERVLDPAAAYLAVSLLEGVVDRGTAARVRRAGMRGPIAGKTGTTDEEHDLWFVGFTPELVAVVWVGFDEPAPVGLPSSAGALPIWTDFMIQVLGKQVRGLFPRPSSVEVVSVDPVSGARALPGCPRQANEIFIRGTAPVRTCPESQRADEQPGFFRRTLGRLFGG